MTGLQTADYDSGRDGFESKKQAPKQPRLQLPSHLSPAAPAGAGTGGTRGINLRIGSGHSDNVTRGPRGDAPSAPELKAGSLMTLLPRLREKLPGGPGSGVAAPLANKLRIGTGHGDNVTLGIQPGWGPKLDRPIQPPRTDTLAPRKKTFLESRLTRDILEGLDRPELTPKLVSKLTKAKTLEKVSKLIRFLPPDLQEGIMALCRSVPVGSGHADNLQY